MVKHLEAHRELHEMPARCHLLHSTRCHKPSLKLQLLLISNIINIMLPCFMVMRPYNDNDDA